jgi:diguanylate cyclase (GGDEF)-like protein
MSGLVAAEMRWPWPDGLRPVERAKVAVLSGLVFLAVFHPFLLLAGVFDIGGPASLFFPIAGLCFVFGFLLGPAYLPVPILAVTACHTLLTQELDSAVAMHIVRQTLLYGGAGILMRLYRARHAAATISARLGCFLAIAVAAVLANLVAALPIFAWADTLRLTGVLTVALTFFLGDLSGLLLVVPPSLLLVDRLIERRQDRRHSLGLTPRDWLVLAALFGAAAIFVLFAIIGFEQDSGIPAAMTPALLPILIGAMLFGHAVGVGLFSLAAALLLAISALVADPPSVVALQTVLIVCCIATLIVGAATSDRARLIARLDASVAERTRQLDARNAVLTRFNAELRAVAVTDHLTGLANRRGFEAELRQRLLLGDAGLGLLILDIDRFKRINDRHGHATGDQALVHVARLLQAGLRRGDFLARVGGEEFAVLCAAADADQLHEVAERLRRMVRAAPLRLAEPGDTLVISISVGGMLAGPADDMDSLLRAADRALYAAKRAGRDRSRIAGPPDREPAAAASG